MAQVSIRTNLWRIESVLTASCGSASSASDGFTTSWELRARSAETVDLWWLDALVSLAASNGSTSCGCGGYKDLY